MRRQQSEDVRLHCDAELLTTRRGLVDSVIIIAFTMIGGVVPAAQLKG
jgi:hypothetical protein